MFNINFFNSDNLFKKILIFVLMIQKNSTMPFILQQLQSQIPTETYDKFLRKFNRIKKTAARKINAIENRDQFQYPSDQVIIDNDKAYFEMVLSLLISDLNGAKEAFTKLKECQIKILEFNNTMNEYTYNCLFKRDNIRSKKLIQILKWLLDLKYDSVVVWNRIEYFDDNTILWEDRDMEISILAYLTSDEDSSDTDSELELELEDDDDYDYEDDSEYQDEDQPYIVYIAQIYEGPISAPAA
jgi:hypothetical protein